MKKTFLAVFASAMLLCACGGGKKDNTVTMTIASHTADCHGVVPMKCMLVKTGDETNWSFFYSQIEGFDYEPGYEYVLKVRVDEVDNPAADASSLKYTLEEVVSTTEKTSDDLPPAALPKEQHKE